MSEQVLLRLYGDLPCKKNRIRAGRAGGHYPAEVKAMLDNLTLQARGQWGSRRPVRDPDIEIFLFVKNWRKDRDGIWTTVLDCLKRAGVIVDDSLACMNGREIKHPAAPVEHIRDERIEIVISEGENSCPSQK